MLYFKFLTFVVVTVPFVAEGDEKTEKLTLKPEKRFTTPCSTSDDENGFCMSLEDCREFKQGKIDENSLTESTSCSPQNKNITLVCCLLSPLSSRGEAKSSEIPIGESPFPKECGRHGIQIPNRIIGGREANLGEFPWLVRLRHKRTDGLRSFGCAGFLVAARYVLTAAHCVRSSSLAALGPIKHVQLGEHNTRQERDCEGDGEDKVCADPPQIIRTGAAIVHEDYDNNSLSQHNDIAIIPLKEPANFTNFVQPICIANESSSETEMFIAGWGKTENGANSHVKLKVSVKRQSLDYCKTKYRTADVEIVSSQLCAGGEEGKDSCSGDSGGPLMVQSGTKPWTAEGIVSFGLGCGLEYWPGVYTNIPSYYRWIQKKITNHWNHNSNKTKRNAAQRTKRV